MLIFVTWTDVHYSTVDHAIKMRQEDSVSMMLKPERMTPTLVGEKKRVSVSSKLLMMGDTFRRPAAS